MINPMSKTGDPCTFWVAHRSMMTTPFVGEQIPIKIVGLGTLATPKSLISLCSLRFVEFMFLGIGENDS